MFYIVVYDSPSDKRRRRLMTHLKNFLFRVQKSVFEGHLPLPDFKRMVEPIRGMLNLGDDSVRIYEIPKDALAKVRVWGLPPLTEDRPYYIINDAELQPGDGTTPAPES